MKEKNPSAKLFCFEHNYCTYQNGILKKENKKKKVV